jgi:hypothetical protein
MARFPQESSNPFWLTARAKQQIRQAFQNPLFCASAGGSGCPISPEGLTNPYTGWPLPP